MLVNKEKKMNIAKVGIATNFVSERMVAVYYSLHCTFSYGWDF